MRAFILIMFLFLLVYVPLFYASGSQLRRMLSPGFVACTVLMTLVGIYAPNIESYFAAIILVFIATVRGRVDAVCRYILLAAVVPQILWRIGASGHYLGAIDSADALAISAYVVAKFDRAKTSGRSELRWTIEDSLVTITFLIMAVGTVGFGNFNDTVRSWIVQFLTIALPYILLRATVKSATEFRAVVACFGVASVFLAVFSIYEVRFGADIFDIITKHITGVYVRSSNIRGSLMRASATMGGALELACFETVGIFALACSRSFFRNAAGYYGSLAFAILGLLAAQSRGSLLALAVSAVVLALALRKWAIAAAATIAAIAAWPVLQILAGVSPAVASFMHGGLATPPQGPYLDYRTLLLQRGLQVAANHPLTGLRMTQVLDSLADITQGEGIVDLVNVYLQILLISGIVGLLPFVALTITSGLRGATGFRRIDDPALLRARGFILAAFTVVLFQLGFVSFINRIPMLFVMSVFGIRLLVQERRAVAKSARSADADEVPAGAENEMLVAHLPAAAPGWDPRLPAIS